MQKENKIPKRFIPIDVDLFNNPKYHTLSNGASAVWGLWGVVFGIPIYAILKIIVSRVYNYYRRESKLFEENAVSSTTGDADHDESE